MTPRHNQECDPGSVGTSGTTPDRVVVGDLVVDLRGREATVEGRIVPLTRIEFDILAYLASRPGWVSSADQLMEDVWGYRSLGDARTVAVHMGNLRRKLGESKDEPRFIRTVRGAGYKLVDPVAAGDTAPTRAGATVPADPEPSPGTAKAEARHIIPTAEPNAALIGRRREMAVLAEAWLDASRGRGAAALVTGETGIGKTRLADELAVHAEATGAVAAWGRCLDADGLPAYWPWIQILERLAATSTKDGWLVGTMPGAAELATVIPSFRHHVSQTHTQDGPGVGIDQERLFEAVVQFVVASSSNRPLLLLFDDLDLADASSLRVLRALAPELAVSPIMIVAMCRDGLIRPGIPLYEALAALEHSRYRHVRLGGLGANDVRQIMSAATGRDISTALAEAVREKTAGNPFFIEELTRLLEAEGRLADAEPGSSSTLALPGGVEGVIERHVARVSPECRDLLTVAALLGTSLDLLVLSGASGLSGDALLPLLDEATEARLLTHESDTGKLRFVHPLVHEVLAYERNESERLRLHARIAETLEAHSIADPETRLPDLAIHFSRAAPLGYGPRAFDYSRRAGMSAHGRFAHEEAVDHFKRALTLLPCSGLDGPAQRREAAALHETTGDVLLAAVRRDEAVGAYHRASSLCAGDDRLTRARLERKTGAAWLTDQEPARAQAAFDSAEETLGPPPPLLPEGAEPTAASLWAREKLEIALQRMAAFYFSGDLTGLSSLLEEARPLADSAGTSQQQAVFSTHYLAQAFRRERYRTSPDTVAYAREHWRRLHLSGDESLACGAEFQYGFALLWADEIDEAQRHLTGCAELAEAMRDHSHLVRALTYLSVVHRLRAQVTEARRQARRVVERASAAHLPGYVAAGTATLAWASLRLDDDARAEEHAREALDLWRAPSAYPFEWLAHWPLVDVLTRRGRAAEAREHVKRMLDPGQQAPPPRLAARMAAVTAGDGSGPVEALLAEAIREAGALNYC